MAYTKAEMVDQVYLYITGGQPVEDADVQREDISIYLENLINNVALIDSRNRRREARMDNVADNGVDPSFLTVEYLSIETDSKIDQKYVKFEKKPILMDNLYGIAEVGPKKGDSLFAKMKSRHEGVGLDYLFDDVTRWYYEKNSGEQRIYFKNISPKVEEVRVAYVPAFDDLEDDDVVPLPSGLEVEVVKQACDYFARQADRPADDLNNHNDDRNAQ